MWSYVRLLVYADKPQTLDHLEDNIRRVIADIRPQMLEKVIENWTSRLDYIRANCGSHMPKIIFKICYNLKKRPPAQPSIEIITVGDLYAYLEAEKMRYVRAKNATTSASMGIECYM
ncbi:hypothetical protein TNCV_904801 [Trichonephila clavipes]|nr:hypothetical protein TNCV_904801 [Trichonephila clavipes]